MSNLDQIDSVNVNIHNRGIKSALKQPQQSQSDFSSTSDIKSKQPKNTALKQQRLPAWQPILTASTVLPLFFIIGVIFLVIGGVLLHYSNIVDEHVIEYTNCDAQAPYNDTCALYVERKPPVMDCKCTKTFKLDKTFEKPVYIYYGLKNFYQNHRRYVKSRDDNQLLGKKRTISQLTADCKPYADDGNFTYAPCGAIANSLFNDTFQLLYFGANNDTTVDVPWLRTGIAWKTDKSVKFGTVSSWNDTIRPKNWQKPVQDLDLLDPSNTGYKNEDLIVWMRTAALPNFRKLYRRIDHDANSFKTGLPSGYYKLIINYNYPVTEFDGEKSFIISTSTWVGGKNPFLGIAYLVIGSLCMVLGFVFLVVHIKYGKKINEEYNALKTLNEVSQ